MEAMFKVGSCYRDGDGDVVRLTAETADGFAWGRFLSGRYEGGSAGCLRLSDGRSKSYLREDWRGNLIPGECDEKGNPISAEKPAEEPKRVETLGELLRPYLQGDPSVQCDEKALAMRASQPKAIGGGSGDIKPAPDWRNYKPDCIGSSHQIAPEFGTVGLGKCE